MKKRLLIYKWGSISEPGFVRAVRKLGYDFTEFAWEIKNHHADAAFAQAFITELHAKRVDVVFSYDYFPLIAMICEMNHIPYVSWIYDCPLYTLQSETIAYGCNFIFCFDRLYAERLTAAGVGNCYHYPLAADASMLAEALRQVGDMISVERYACDISFVGNLYNEEKNRLRHAGLKGDVAAKVEEIVSAQLPVYGENLIRKLLSEGDAEEIAEKCRLRLGAGFLQDTMQMAADAVGMEVSAREREAVLVAIGKRHPLRLYTSSELPDAFSGTYIEKKGYADYGKEVPLIFRNSKINLNITSKTIESGIPQRIFDVLACGGFCLTNYQTEVAEYLTDGEDLVMYTGMDDLLEKVNYYLGHEEERARIAENGRKKILSAFALERKVEEMLKEFGV